MAGSRHPCSRRPTRPFFMQISSDTGHLTQMRCPCLSAPGDYDHGARPPPLPSLQQHPEGALSMGGGVWGQGPPPCSAQLRCTAQDWNLRTAESTHRHMCTGTYVHAQRHTQACTHMHTQVCTHGRTHGRTRVPPQLHGGRNVRTQGLLWLHRSGVASQRKSMFLVCTEAAGSTEGYSRTM